MPPPIQVVLAAYDPAWPSAAGYAEQLRAAVRELVAVHHIGSTAVAGLEAQPIIDLMPLARSLSDLDDARGRIAALGYRWHGEYGISGRYCTLDDAATGVRLVRLHCFRVGSAHAVRHLAFRDYPRAFPEVARDDAAEKRRARALFPDDSYAYGDVKSAWIRKTEAAALAWYAATDVGAGASG